jgi:hypothetical protein
MRSASLIAPASPFAARQRDASGNRFAMLFAQQRDCGWRFMK